MRFYLAGQTNFGNRGCEALVRSTVGLVSVRCPGAEFLVPSFDPAADSLQWSGGANALLHYVEPLTVPSSVRWWNRIVSRWPLAARCWEPKFDLPPAIARDVATCDALLMIGGDNISLDYGLGSLFLWSGMVDAAARMGRKTMLFAASVGPFSKDPQVERYMVNHLRRYDAITVRESESYSYLKNLGVEGAELVADPAFSMVPEPCDVPAIFSQSTDGVLGLNISPLIQSVRNRSGRPADIAVEAAAFVDRVLETSGLAVALIPHVDPLDGGTENSDSAYMTRILSLIKSGSGRVALLPRTYNAAQLKFLISQCRIFIGARTHATVAAWSTGVPTISIAYSVKAKGLNKDLFDSLDYVLDTPNVDCNSLWSAFVLIKEREGAVRTLLGERIPQWRLRSGNSVTKLQGMMQ